MGTEIYEDSIGRVQYVRCAAAVQAGRETIKHWINVACSGQHHAFGMLPLQTSPVLHEYRCPFNSYQDCGDETTFGEPQ